ncbi:MAG: tryptophan synthase subunit alpha [Candidatus Omnitrophota bacterium]
MNRIDEKFGELKAAGMKTFIAYITAGDPDLGTTARLVRALEVSGVDILELGIPFSDPVADGPTIQAASQRALRKKASLRKIFEMAGRLRKDTAIPMVFMTYYNPVFKYGVSRFFKSCKRHGIDGVIIPDLPIEEGKEVIRLGRASGVATIFLIAPTSTADRINKIADSSRGFIYYVSLTGVTGARRTLPAETISRIRSIKSVTRKPVAAGFGISNAKQAGAIARVADGVIVGSAIVRIIEANRNNPKRMLSEVSRFSKKLAEAIHGT